jgi:hypothetical protein
MTTVLVFAGAAMLVMIAHCAPARTSVPEEEHATRGLAHALVIIDSQGQIVQL